MYKSKKSISAFGKPHPKQQFTLEEDIKLQSLVQKYGTKNWQLISIIMQNRNERQCKERWTKYLSPDLNNTPWTEEEDRLLVRKVKEIGQKWVKISKEFNKRTDANLKNRWNVLQRRARLFGGDVFTVVNASSSTSFASSSSEDIEQTPKQPTAPLKNEKIIPKNTSSKHIKSDPHQDVIDDSIFKDLDFLPFMVDEGFFEFAN
jgi:hypothetical protein